MDFTCRHEQSAFRKVLNMSQRKRNKTNCRRFVIVKRRKGALDIRLENALRLLRHFGIIRQ